MIKAIIDRIRDACVTNDPQFDNVFMFTLLNCAVASKSNRWEAWVLALLWWPCFAFIANLIDPIPRR